MNLLLPRRNEYLPKKPPTEFILSKFSFPFHFQIIGGFCALIGVFILALPVPIVVNRSVQWRGNCTLGKKIIVPLSSVYHSKWLHIQYIHFPVILYSYTQCSSCIVMILFSFLYLYLLSFVENGPMAEEFSNFLIN